MNKNVSKILTTIVAALSLSVLFATQPRTAQGDQAGASGRAYAECRLRCTSLFNEYATACGTGTCKEKCAGAKSKEEGCKSCVENCLAPKKQEIVDCHKKCPPPK
ncbi:hypothetical protein LVJ94_21090 [Pendulispora rubella]|uniref:Uncharacterized protein n=1 Tax=Pendulispora rubella TaxID=2741070 RepID=A0ABZ2LFK8_9BACT